MSEKSNVSEKYNTMPQNEKVKATEAVKTTETATKAYNEPDDDEYVYPADIIGLTAEEMIALIGEPDEIEKGGLGGVGKDTCYYYELYDCTFYALYAPESSYNFDDRNAVINVVNVNIGDLNKYVHAGMTREELTSFYDVSDYSHNVLDDTYRADANITCNGISCHLTATSIVGEDDFPIDSFLVTANDLYN